MKNSRFFVKIVTILLTIALLCSSLVALTACDDEEVVQKKAIVICTALFSGGLYDTASTGTAFWDPLPGDPYLMDFFDDAGKFIGDLIGGEGNLAYILNLLTPVLTDETDPDYVATDDILYNLSLDQDGNSLNPNVKSTTDYDGRQHYGVLNAYTTQFNDLTAKYPDYEVVMFDYDWRRDNALASKDLEDFINANGYTDVVLTSHSMGGCVVAGYLARSQANRDKVRAYCSYASAFLGAVDALYFLENGKDIPALINSMLAGTGFETNSLVQMVLGSLDTIVTKAKRLLENMTSIIQLLPTWEYVCSDQFASETLNYLSLAEGGNVIDSAEDLYAFYESRTWARKTNEDGTYMLDSEGNYVLKPAVAGLRAFHESMYVDVSGEKVFSTTLVNTHYFVGNDVKTKVGMVYVTKTASGYPEDDEIPADDNIIYNMEGDNMVPLYSALGGLSKNYIASHDNQTLYELAGKTHVEVGCDWDILKENTYKIIEAALA